MKIAIGAHTPGGLNRVANYCDGWIPIAPRTPDLKASISDLHARAEKFGRQASELSVSAFMAPAEEAVLNQYQELGIERAIFAVPSQSRDKVLPILDHYATFIPKVS